MIGRTLFVVGPGGIGKSPLDHVFRDDVLRIDPYRLRTDGPRDAGDVFYGHPHLRDDLRAIFRAVGAGCVQLAGDVEWYPSARTLLMRVRRNWQVLVLPDRDADLAKGEIHALVLPTLLAHPAVREAFGDVDILLLHPGTALVADTTDPVEIEERTRINCSLRGDTAASVAERVGSIRGELAVWRTLLAEGATECASWAFPEHAYKGPGLDGPALARHQTGTLNAARSALLATKLDLAPFLRTDAELEAIDRPIVR